jgi:4-diphosphocytidyl-2-C-methyl-D-erythritol kinase
MGKAGGMADVVAAPAKLTLSLRVTGVRDDGYHFIDAEMVALDLHDELTIEPGVNHLDPDNLVSRALVAVDLDAHVELDKRIPVGAGLGGGSADAAAILRWAGCTDLQLAATLGADVPFCLMGGRARVRGVGEVVEPLPYEHRVFTLLTPPFPVSTPAVYEMWDVMGGPTADGPNDLEPAALRYEPRLEEWRDELIALTGKQPMLAGSGGTWFVEGAFWAAGRVVHTRKAEG